MSRNPDSPSAPEHTQPLEERLGILANLSRLITATLSRDQLLDLIVTRTAHLFHLGACLLLLPDQTREHLAVGASSPPLVVPTIPPLPVDSGLWKQLDEGVAGRQFTAPDTAPLNPLGAAYQSVLLIPLMVGREHGGVLALYDQQARILHPEEDLLLTILASQVALVLKNGDLTDLLRQRNLVQEFLDELLRGTTRGEEALRQQALVLGCDLLEPHAVVLILIVTPTSQRDDQTGQGPTRRATDAITLFLEERFPGTLCQRHDQLLTCLLPLTGFQDVSGSVLKLRFREVSRQLHKDGGAAFIGISTAIQSIGDYPRGFAEASGALTLSQTWGSAGSVVQFHDLGIYRYLSQMTQPTEQSQDPYQELLGRIASYDRRNAADLLSTLETYLECGGNSTNTAAALGVHIHTLAQRMGRIREITSTGSDKGIDVPGAPDLWLPLHLAIKAYRRHSAS